MGLLAVWYADFFGAQTRGRAALRPVPQALPRLPAAAHDGVERQARHARRRARRLRHRGRSSGASRAPTGSTRFYQLIHQGTRLIPCDFIGFAQSLNPLGEHHDLLIGERLRAGRGAGVRQDRRGGARRGDAGAGRAAPRRSRATGPPTRSWPSGSRPQRSARSSRSTSTACSPRARSGASTRSTSGASSWARRWRSGSFPSSSRRRARARSRQLDERLDPPLQDGPDS